MMIFLTLFFIFSTVYSLFKGKLFHKTMLESAEFDIEKAKGKVKDMPSELVVKLLSILVYVLIVLSFQMVYVIKATNIDPYLYPTVGFIGYVMLTFIVGLLQNKKDLTTDEGRFLYLAKAKKRHTFTGKFGSLVYLTYFVYMFAVLLEIIK